MKIIIGQEAVCPDVLGRVVKYESGVCKSLSITIETYVGNRSCSWDSHNVQLINPFTKEIEK